MLPHSHSNVTAARYMSHTRPPHAHASMQDTHASTWSSLQGKLEERNTHRQRGHLPTGTEHRTGPSTTQSPIQICSTALFFFRFLAVSNTGIQRRQRRERGYRQRCYEMQTKEMANQGRRKEEKWKRKKNISRWEGEMSHFYTQVTQFDSAGAIF